MFQFQLPVPLLQFRLKGPAFVPLFTFPPEITSRAQLCSLIQFIAAGAFVFAPAYFSYYAAVSSGG